MGLVISVALIVTLLVKTSRAGINLHMATPEIPLAGEDLMIKIDGLEKEIDGLEKESEEMQHTFLAIERTFLASLIAGNDATATDCDNVLSDSSGSDGDMPDSLADLMLEPQLPASVNGVRLMRTWGAERSLLIRAFLVMIHPGGFGGQQARGSRESICRALGLTATNFRSFVATWEDAGFMKGAAVVALAEGEGGITALLNYIVSHEPGGGWQMLAFVCGWARAIGVTRLFSAADLTMPGALRWHERQGFNRVSKTVWEKAGHHLYSDASRVKYMSLDLA